MPLSNETTTRSDLIDHPVISAIKPGELVTDEQLLALEREMRRQLGGEKSGLNEDKIRRRRELKESL